MQVIKYLLYTVILLLILTFQSYSQSVFSSEELQQQANILAELKYLRSSNKVLTDNKAVLESTIKIQTEIDNLKTSQIKTLLEVIASYEEIKGHYEQQIKFQQSIIENSNKIIETQQKIKKSGNALDTIKSVLFALLGVITGRIIN